MFNIFTFLVVLFPITAIYQSPIPGVELSTFCLLLLFPFMIKDCIKKDIKIKIMLPLSILLLYTFVNTLINLIGNNVFYLDVPDILFRTMRFEILLIIVLFFGMSYWFDFTYALKLLRAVTLAAVSYLIIQQMVYSLTGFILPGFIEGITKMDWKYTPSLPEFASTYRPTSFFLEPSAFVEYVTIYLTYCLFSSNGSERKNIFEAFYTTVGIYFSTSGQGLIVAAILWLMWSIKKLLQKESTQSKMAFWGVVLPIMIGLALLAVQSDIGKFTINRMVADTEYNAVEARSGGYLFYDQLPMVAKIVGVGYGNYPEDTYFSSFAEILFTTGLIGAVLVINMYFWAFLKGRLFQKILCISSFILMSGGGIYTASSLCIYLPFLMFNANTGKLQGNLYQHEQESMRL